MSLRIESCTITAFGPLTDLHLDALDHPVVVLQGRNEAGKTAFFHFLQTMFYGIYPTDAGKHPYAPRTGQPLEGQLEIRVGGDPAVEVTRRLRSRPQGRIREADGNTQRLRNRTLPVAQHVPQSVYESVYALQLEDMVRPKADAWDEIQDRLLGTLSVDHLRPAREVVEALEDEATDLWRTDNRGKPAAKTLEQERRSLRDEAREARERDKDIRRLKDEMATHTQRIDALKEEQIELEAEQRRAERLVPVRTLLRKIEELEAQAGDLAPYEDLSEDPLASIEELDEQIEELEARIEKKQTAIESHRNARQAYTDADERVQQNADAIRAWGRRVERHEKQQTDLDTARREAADAERRLDDAADVLSEPWREEWAEPIRQLSLADLRERVKMFEQAAQTLRETRARAETIGLHAQARKPLVPWIAVAVVGGALAVLGLMVSLPVAGVPVAGGGIALLGVIQGLSAWQHNRRLDTQEEQLDLDAKEAQAARRAKQVERLVGEIPLPPERLEHPSSDLVTDLQLLKSALRDRDAAARAVEEQEAALEEAEADLRQLVEECGPARERDDRSVAALVSALENRLDAAQTRKEEAEAATDALPDLRSEVEALKERRANLQNRRDSIHERLAGLGDGDPVAGADVLTERRTAARRAEDARDRLHSEHPEWETYREEIEALEDEEGWAYTDEERARIDQRLDEIQDARREEEKAWAGKEKDVEHLLEKRTVGEIESELAQVERRLEEVREERDRRMLLAGIIRKADADFRSKHQPDVVRRASKYLRTVTGGRYEQLVLDEHDNRLVVHEAGEGLAQPVRPPLSRGTLDQIYLSLRLAIIDHLDADGARLPVFLDEVFVNWDPVRREAGFDILRDMASERQVFFFTCHPHFAQEAAHHLDAHHLDLTALRDGGPFDRQTETNAEREAGR